ncbi:MAG TPA: hypothetical protein VGB52_10655 [Actinomycetota bacterium]
MSALAWLPQRARAPLAAVLVVVVLLASIGVAFRRDPLAFLFPFGRGPGLDYSGPEAGFVPLEPGYVADVLGERVADPDAADGPVAPARTRSRPRSIVDPHPLTNDRMADARHVSSIPYAARTDASGATREPGEPSECSSEGGTVWYRYTAGDEGALIATVSVEQLFAPPRTEGVLASGHLVTLGVFEGVGLAPVGCTDNRGNRRASLQFETEAETTYLFQIAADGPFQFGLNPPPRMHLVSTTPDGEPGDSYSFDARISGDGRIVAFASAADDIVPGAHDPNCWQQDPQDAGVARTGFGLAQNCDQVLVRDRATGETVAASVSSAGEPGNGASRGVDISGDGRYVVFESWATNLVPGDTNRVADIFVHDLVTRRTERVSVNSRGEQTLGASFEAHSFEATISDDGRKVAFASAAPNLVDGDAPGTMDVFVRDRVAGTTELVSGPLDPSDVTTWPERLRDGVQTPDDFPLYDEYMLPCISPDGIMVAFKSHASDLVPGDTNGYADWFVRDLDAGVTERISVASDGTQGDGHAGMRDHSKGAVRGNCFSAGNRYVVFDSEASNLVPGDTNERGDGFVRDRWLGTTTRVTIDPVGEEFARESHFTTMSRDGRWVAFLGSDRARLLGEGLAPLEDAVPGGIRFGLGDEPRVRRGVFIRDMLTGSVEWIPLLAGQRASGEGSWLDLSSDGRLLALNTNFPTFNEDPDHPSWYVGCTENHDLVYERVGEGCYDASNNQVYVVERWTEGAAP